MQDKQPQNHKTVIITVCVILLVVILGITGYLVYNARLHSKEPSVKINEIQLLERLEALYAEVSIVDSLDAEGYRTASIFFGFGIFTTDLEKADIQVNDSTIRIILDPIQLTTYGIDEDRTKLLYANSKTVSGLKGFFITNDTKAGGVIIASEQRKSIYEQIRNELESNEDLYERARKQAISSIKNFVRSINANRDDLIISVVFKDEQNKTDVAVSTINEGTI